MIEIIKLKNNREMNGIFVQLSKQDALELIESLAHQIRTSNPNTDRKEWSSIKNKLGLNYFTISVNELQGGE